MALTIVDFLRAVNPNIGLVQNPDGSFRIGVEDVNSDEILTALGTLLTGIVLAAGSAIIGRVGHDITGIVSGSKAGTAGTAVRLAAASIGAKLTLVQARPANTQRGAIGGSTVDETPATVNGTILNPGESAWIPLDPYNIYWDPATGVEGVIYNAFT